MNRRGHGKGVVAVRAALATATRKWPNLWRVLAALLLCSIVVFPCTLARSGPENRTPEHPGMLMFAEMGRPFKSGEELARRVIADARGKDGVVDLSKYAAKTCFVPEGAIYPPSHAARLLPGFEIVFLETTQTDGYWFFLLGSEDQKAWIFAVRQSTLRWKVPESASAIDLARCVSVIHISTKDQVPTMELN
jgi:hypothetical protein